MSYAETRTARKDYRCDDDCDSGGIATGEEYARWVAFPDDEILGDRSRTRPVVLRVCRRCQTRYGRIMPPRRRVGSQS